MARARRAPQRTCVGCRSVLAKRVLLRLARGPQGVFIDPTGKAHGRGAYLHNRRACWERALQSGALERALNATLAEADRERLWQVGQAMPSGAEGEGSPD